MDKISIQYIATDYGELILGSYQQSLCLCDWRYRKMRAAIDKRIQEGLNTGYHEEESLVILEAKKQLNEYFSSDRTEFDISLKMIGSSFQQEVWHELMKIPFGKTDTYLGLSQKINNEKAIRAVAAANGANAIAIFVPCHRIIGSKGELVGYAGGLKTKKNLLQLESGNASVRQMELFEETG